MVLLFKWGLALSVFESALVIVVNTTLFSLYSSGKSVWFIALELKVTLYPATSSTFPESISSSKSDLSTMPSLIT